MGQTVLNLVQTFEEDPFTVARTLREMRDADPEAFEWAAFRSLAELKECPGTRHLVTLLHEEESLLRRVSDPQLLELTEAVRLINALRQADPQTEVRLVRLIMPGAEPMPPACVDRILDLIDAVTDSPKLVPVLMQLYRAAPEKVRARLATTIGRHHRNRDWLDQRLRDADSRVRANMIEVLWGETSKDAIGIFSNALRDVDGRVRGNAALGLYRAGCIEALGFLAKEMAASDSPMDRVSAAWAMGATRDVRFQKILAGFVKDPDPRVRRHAYHALSQMKREQDRLKDRVPCHLRFIKLRRPAEGLLHILFEVKQAHSQVAVRGIRPIEILVEENGEPVFEYQVVERLKYPQPGVYDLHYQPGGAETRMLKVEVRVSTPTHAGAHSSYWFGE